MALASLVVATAFTGCMSLGFGGSVTIPSLTDEFEVVYWLGKVKEDDHLIEYRSEGEYLVRYDPFTGGESECLVVQSKNNIGGDADFCIALGHGQPIMKNPNHEQAFSLGRQFGPAHDAMPPIFQNFLVGILQGQVLRGGQSFQMAFSGAVLDVHVGNVKRSTVEVEMVATLYELEPLDGRPITGEWERERWRTKYLFDADEGPFPVKVGVDSTTYARLDSLTLSGKEMDAFVLESAPFECPSCEWAETGRYPPAGTFDGSWALGAAFEVALRDSRVKSFHDRNEDVMVTKANYRFTQERETVLGPIGETYDVEFWDLRLSDPNGGEQIDLLMKRVEGEPPSIERVESSSSAYIVGQGLWPDRLVDPASWWPWIKAGTDGGYVEEVRFNDGNHPAFFGGREQLWVWAADPLTLEGMPPAYLSWKIIVAYPGGGAEFFTVSAVNGQLLGIPGRFIDENIG